MDDWSRAIQEGPTPVPWATVGCLAGLLWGAFVLLCHLTFGALACDDPNLEGPVSCATGHVTHSLGYLAPLILTLAGIALLLIALILRRAPSAWVARAAGYLVTALGTLLVAVSWFVSLA